MFDVKAYLQEQRQLVEQALLQYMLPAEGDFAAHIETMRYSLFVGGKRVRPILCLTAARCLSSDAATAELLLPAACALECIHTYSLIHDDLPAMDNDDLRRGQPTCHKKFGEAEAILAGDGLLTYAFELISSDRFPGPAPEIRLRLTAVLAQAAGSLGMVGGKFLDIASEQQEIPFERLRTIHRSKTGALIRAAVQMGAIGGGADEVQLAALSKYGSAVGLAFQIADDLLDVTASTEQLGKTAGSDAGRFVRHIEKEMDALFTFLLEEGVEPTNNPAERMIRFGVLQRKRSQGTNSGKGNRWVERILSLRQTCLLRGKSTFETLTDAVRCSFRGQMPDLSWV